GRGCGAQPHIHRHTLPQGAGRGRLADWLCRGCGAQELAAAPRGLARLNREYVKSPPAESFPRADCQLGTGSVQTWKRRRASSRREGTRRITMRGMQSPTQEMSTISDQPGRQTPRRYRSQKSSTAAARKPAVSSTSMAEDRMERR